MQTSADVDGYRGSQLYYNPAANPNPWQKVLQ